ncbi:MAG: hypothetical protein ALAOOOJD_01573 [bacterium]|nr:hypothetical protein [bacterium]
MQRHDGDDEIRAPNVQLPKKPAERHFFADEFDTLIGGRRAGLVIKQQQHTGKNLQRQQDERRKPERVQPAHVSRLRLRKLAAGEFG